jgi:hypothetical protein
VSTPASPPPPAVAPSAARDLRRHLLHLVLGVLALHAVAITFHRVAGVDAWPSGQQRLFTIVWVALTLVVVSVFLSRVRAARIRARRARAGRR